MTDLKKPEPGTCFRCGKSNVETFPAAHNSDKRICRGCDADLRKLWKKATSRKLD